MEIRNLRLQDDGTIDGASTLTVTRTFSWVGGTMTGGGTTILAAQCVTTVDAPGLRLSRNLRNDGILDWRNGDLEITQPKPRWHHCRGLDRRSRSVGGTWRFLQFRRHLFRRG